jgi:hypothetical protein
VDTGCLAAFSQGIDYDIERAGNLKSMVFRGEGLFLATLRGTGTVYLQSLPFSRLANRVLQAGGMGIGNKNGWCKTRLVQIRAKARKGDAFRAVTVIGSR